MTLHRSIARRGLLLGAAAACLAGPALARIAAPRIEPLKRVPRTPYDPGADADAAVRAAEARAKASGKLLLIDMGGNWCADCLIVSGIMELPTARAFLAKHYEIVLVDVGRIDRNLQIPARYGMKKLLGVPAVIVVDPKGRVLNPDDAFALADARAMSNQAVLDKLASWVP
ncbi:MAG: thiol reductase thioredoxin [Caulobacter sp.]|nr:thiol reductase thioredoxin [Caulobacter sp.]